MTPKQVFLTRDLMENSKLQWVSGWVLVDDQGLVAVLPYFDTKREALDYANSRGWEVKEMSMDDIKGTTTGRFTSDTPNFSEVERELVPSLAVMLIPSPYQRYMIETITRGDRVVVIHKSRGMGMTQVLDLADIGTRLMKQGQLTAKVLEPHLAPPKNKPWYGKFDKKRKY